MGYSSIYGFFQLIISVGFKFRALTHDYTNSVEILTQLITNTNYGRQDG